MDEVKGGKIAFLSFFILLISIRKEKKSSVDRRRRRRREGPKTKTTPITYAKTISRVVWDCWLSRSTTRQQRRYMLTRTLSSFNYLLKIVNFIESWVRHSCRVDLERKFQEFLCCCCSLWLKTTHEIKRISFSLEELIREESQFGSSSSSQTIGQHTTNREVDTSWWK